MVTATAAWTTAGGTATGAVTTAFTGTWGREAAAGAVGITEGAADVGMVPIVRAATGAATGSTRAATGIGAGAGSLDSATTGALGASTTGGVRTLSGARAGAMAGSASTFLAPFLRGLSSSG